MSRVLALALVLVLALALALLAGLARAQDAGVADASSPDAAVLGADALDGATPRARDAEIDATVSPEPDPTLTGASPAGGRTQIEEPSTSATPPAVEPSPPDAATLEGHDRVHAPAPPIDHRPGYIPGVGSARRDLEAALRVIAADSGTALGELSIRGALYAHQDDNGRYVLLAGTRLGVAYDRRTPIGTLPTVDVAFLATSPADRFRLEVGAELLLPSAQEPHPSDIDHAARLTLASGAARGSIWLPSASVGVVGRLVSSYRLWQPGWPIHVHARFEATAGGVEIATWLGAQSSFVGSVSLDLGVGIEPLNMRVLGRMSVSTAAAWPAGDVAPWAGTAVVEWSPEDVLKLEVFVGGGGFLLPDGLEARVFRGGLGVSVFADYDPPGHGDTR